MNLEDLHSQVCDLSTVVDQGAFEFDVDFVIPPSTEPSVLNAHLIRVGYGLRFTLDVPWALRTLVLVDDGDAKDAVCSAELNAEAGLRIDPSVGKDVIDENKTRSKL